jgi:predicted dehydrogenase
MHPIRIGILGIGKIATDQHIPVLRDDSDFAVCAAASRHHRLENVENFQSLDAMLNNMALDAVSICTPPQNHYDAAKLCLEHGKHVLLEKPPCASTLQLDELITRARKQNLCLFASWHSRFAPGVAPAKRRLANRKVRSVRIVWKEDVRRWHPGQAWIWQAGGFGVFDPGINALSILTEILPEGVHAESAVLSFPGNCDAPIAAELTLRTEGGAPVSAVFDFRHTGDQTWNIEIETDAETLLLSKGGAQLSVGGKPIDGLPDGPHAEYAPLYRHFAELIRAAQCDADARPFRLVADAFLLGQRVGVEDFHE